MLVLLCTKHPRSRVCALSSALNYVAVKIHIYIPHMYVCSRALAKPTSSFPFATAICSCADFRPRARNLHRLYTGQTSPSEFEILFALFFFPLGGTLDSRSTPLPSDLSRFEIYSHTYSRDYRERIVKWEKKWLRIGKAYILELDIEVGGINTHLSRVEIYFIEKE